MEGAIAPNEIREIRKSYGLTQKSFAQLLGLGTASIVRYEQGIPPSKANANLIRAARHPEFMLECLERDGELISEQQRDKATRCIYALVSLDPEEGGQPMEPRQLGSFKRTKMDEVYHYTLQQEVLNEQAANLIGEMISVKVSGGFKGSANQVFDCLLDQVANIKPTIVRKDCMDDGKLSRIRGYLSCAGDLLARLTHEVA